MKEVKEIDVIDLLSDMLKKKYDPALAYLLDVYKHEKTPSTRIISKVCVTEVATQNKYEVNIIKRKS